MSFRSSKLVFASRAIILATALALIGTSTLLAQTKSDSSAAVTASVEPKDSGVDDTSRTVDLVVTSTTPAALVSATLALAADHTHGCEVTASAEIERTTNATGTYIFGISLDNSSTTVASSDRRVEMVATADIDVIWEDAATNQGFSGLSGSHTFFFSVRKQVSGDPNATITAATISVVCMKKQF